MWQAWLLSASISLLGSILAWLDRSGPQWPLIQGFFEDPNSLAAYLLLGLFVAVGLCNPATRWSLNGWPVLMGLALFGMLLFTSSRAGLLAFLAVTLAFAVYQSKKHLLRLAPLLVLLAGLLLLGGIFRFYPERDVTSSYALSRVFDSARQAVKLEGLIERFQVTRRNLWWGALEMARERPLTGVGPGLYYRNVRNYYPQSGGGWRPEAENAHNYYLQVLAELGWPGLLAFLLLIGSWLVPYWRQIQDRAWFQTALLAGAASYLIILLAGNSLLLVRHLVIFGGFVGWLQIAPESQKKAPRKSSWGIIIFGGLLLAALFLQFVLNPPRRRCPGSPSGAEYAWGFHPLESDGVRSWRWMKDRGMVCLCPPDPEGIRGRLALQVASFDQPRELRITLPGEWQWQQPVSVASTRLVTPSIPRRAERACFYLEVSRSAEIPSQLSSTNDDRKLSIRVEEFRLQP